MISPPPPPKVGHGSLAAALARQQHRSLTTLKWYSPQLHFSFESVFQPCKK
jgi:hypothetical protein